MSIEHKDIQEAGLHEPKGASTATVGETYVSDGAGSGTWKYPQIVGQSSVLAGRTAVSDGAGGVTWKFSAGSLFGDMHFTANTRATNITTASPTRGDGNAKLITGATLVAPGILLTQGVVDTIAFENAGNNELLRVPVAGVYEVSFSASFTGGGGGAGNIYRFCIAVNGSEVLSHASIKRQTASGDVGAVALSEYVLLAANDTVQMAVGNESGVNDPTISNMSFNIILLKEV